MYKAFKCVLPARRGGDQKECGEEARSSLQERKEINQMWRSEGSHAPGQLVFPSDELAPF